MNNRVVQPILVGGLTLVNLVAGFIAQWLVFISLGVGAETDALFASLAVPQVAFSVVSGSLSNVLIPMFAGQEAHVARHQASAAYTLICIATIPIIWFLHSLAPHWVPFLWPGFTGDTQLEVIYLARIQILSLIFTLAFGVVYAAALAQEQFVKTEMALMGASVMTMLGIYPAAWIFGVQGIAWVFVIKAALRVFVLVWIAQVHLTYRLRGANLREVARRVIPLAASSVYGKSELLVDQFFASMAPAGALSLLNLAQALQNASFAVFNRPILRPLATRLGHLVHLKQYGEMGRLTWTYSAAGIGVGGLIFVFWITLGLPLLEWLIGHGPADAEKVIMLWRLILALSGVFVGLVVGQITALGFYALGETRLASILIVVAFTAGIFFKWLGFLLGGVVGLALGTSVYFVFSFIIKWIVLNKRLVVRAEEVGG